MYQTIHGGVSHRHSQHLKTKEEFSSKSYTFSQRFVILAWCHPLIIVFDCENSFLTIRSISWVVSISFLRRPSCHNSSFSACSYRSPNLTGASFKYPLISSCSLRSHVSKSLQVSSFVFKFFPVNCSLATLFSNFHSGVSRQFMVVFLVVILRFWRPKKSFYSKSYRCIIQVFSNKLMISSFTCI